MNESRDVSNEHGVEGCPYKHADDCHPHLSDVLWRESTESDAQHVGYGLEHCPGVLLTNTGTLQVQFKTWSMEAL